MRQKLTYLGSAILLFLSLKVHATNYLDDPCLPPSNIEITEVTSYSVNFEWTYDDIQPSTLFQYVITAPDEEPLGGPVTPNTQASSIGYNLLSSSTTYNLYLRTLCMGVWSDWSDAISFTTASCDVVDMPFIQDFQNLTPFFNLVECTTWEVITGNYWNTNQTPVDGFDGNTLSYNAHETQDANSWYIFENGINMESDDKIKVSFKYASNGIGTEALKLYSATSIDDLINGNGLTIANLSFSETTVTEFVAGPIPVSETGVYYFGFQALSAANQGTIYIDDFKVESWVCGTPSEIEITDIDTDGAIVSWVATGDNTVYFYQYIVSTEPIEPTDTTEGIIATGAAIGNIIQDLDAQTTYYVYVRASCSGVWSDWSEAVSFTTLCDTLLPTPIGETTQTLLEGQTLADLIVEGDNLTWYADAELTTELPETTEVVDGTTYYVTQTIDGCESEALAITVEVTLSIGDVHAVSFNIYPNPVKDVLNISSSQEITQIEVLNVLGQTVVSVSVNTTETQIDMSNLLVGNYFVKITANNSIKTVKVIK